ncbi:hypothetical protein Calab_3146 [Caldithrix abyssi DSM 13497]|uniref:DUF362 domain-containing protein n=1 Tax=Caldithrix abyssi DSM 13497 TaxID=880073 RepID=H1XUC6_CALAY|nr:DUF362 domain-containing protein [Caldithrix abyssi]APF18774.1 protein of unknown function (DUF362) [Caldithrix abyssi DSM 13497]EHO42752.1 hypothetical protein Calab_3146 [Caldithrix abyssi DSM 13497]
MRRRYFLEISGKATAASLFFPLLGRAITPKPFPPEELADIYVVQKGPAAELTERLIELLGGIDRLVGSEDVVLLKVNSQWWAQGMTNTDVLLAFIRKIVERPNFKGEVIIADNHQSKTPNSRGWNTARPNGKLNYNDLVLWFHQKGFSNVNKVHWHPAGPNPHPLQFGGSGNSVVKGPEEGDGYVWDDALYYQSPYGNKTILSYPIFTSPFSGRRIDFKNGVWQKGKYLDVPLKLFNFSALNHHSAYAGVTASVKNFMGVVDMSCGYPAPQPQGTYNTHHIGVTPLFKLLARYRDALKKMPGFYGVYLHPEVFRFHFTGGVLGKFMKVVRRADLNIITAIKVGWGSRTDADKAMQTDSLIASTDPVALDFWAAKHVLLPATKAARAPEKYLRLNDPERTEGPFRRFLEECRRELGGTLSEEKMIIHSN